jgi:segregation and condensation protein B
MLDELAKILNTNSLGYVKQQLEELKAQYGERGIEVVSTDRGWHLQVKPAVLPSVAHLTPYSDLSEGSKRTLALVVYKEPVKQADIINIQGSKAYSYIRELERKSLIRTEKRGSTKVILLTMEFERYFGEEKDRLKEKLRKIGGQMEKRMESGAYAEPESRSQKTLIDVDGVPLAKQPSRELRPRLVMPDGSGAPVRMKAEKAVKQAARPEENVKKAGMEGEAAEQKKSKKYASPGTDKISIDQEISF